MTYAICESDARAPSFDPEALERGAKALREINASPNAKKVIELSRQQEVTKQQEFKSKEAQYQAAAQQAAIEREKVHWEEQRKSMQADQYNKAELARYEDELARKRAEAEHEKQRVRQVELVQLQEESVAKQEAKKYEIQKQIEAERRATEQYRAELEKKVQREKALAEAEGRAREARENEDVNRRALTLRLEEERKKLVEAINTTFGHLGAGVTSLLTDVDRMTTLIAGLSILALGVYSARESTRVGGKAIDRWLGTPKLVRETSRRHWWNRAAGGGGGSMEKATEAVKRDFSDIVLPGGLQDHVRALAAVTANTRAHGAPFRHMLFYGPPGTGKSMAAKRLARTAGLDYAIMSGGDVAPLGGKAVQQLHEMFDWAESSRRGLLLFIDEADAFLGRRGNQMSEGLRAALNAALFRTGDQSRDFAVVLATNRPADLDPAVLDRMDEALEFPLPGPAERARILDIYLNSYIAKAGSDEGARPAALVAFLRGRSVRPDAIQLKGITPELVQEAAATTEGFSGRELAKLVASMQASVYGSREAALTPEIFRKVLQMKLREHEQRLQFEQQAGEEQTQQPSQ
ncbi:AAA-domain-containing protein [Coccomyxa subellipsoidea C-169]|uniref:AAA-domain-containing protein n=1 Tax=Coccomyxa subellipsoidea (strain C-169) TaxID=574566 RepID=I0YKP1_COCSC|nr:AAA-domain-containing protein [Coccomyxa subellipsoidea C-169]EIE18960.1 AAA-domain-containing protein [Coccomyxa subellipsoidea C-169]|eukprot:XP_005643504.1 AAA-domain-containing protein [Coccomyxa subellipsoidea C-169]